MKHKEDIGTLFERKFKAAEKAPTNELWTRIDATLESESKRRRRFLWFFYGSVGLLGILLLLFIVNPFATESDAISTSPILPVIPSEDNSEKPANNNHNTVVTDTVLETNLQNRSPEKLVPDVKISDISEESDLNRKPKSKKPQHKKKSEKITDEFYEVKTTYYYYNSELGKQVKTTNKDLIDSLLQSTTNHLDSTIEYKKTIYNKKPTDSVD
tara:strand:- start:1911 stop:2549 length:639 start_codon:yes stop_codon:yes gene_type:complete